MKTRSWLSTFGCAVMIVGCSNTENENPKAPSQCGDAICSEDESIAICPEDCYRSGTLQLDLDHCRAALSDQELAEAIALGVAFVDRLTVFRDVWDLGSRLALDASVAPLQLAYDPEGDVISAPFSFDPQTGTYSKELPVQGSGSLQVQFRFGTSYQCGGVGTPIRDYLFRTESYLVGATVKLGSWEATVGFATPGPLVELLGMGPNPPNPFTMGLFEASNEMGKQHQKWAFSVDQQLPGPIRIQLGAEIEADHLQIDDEQIPITLKHATADHGTAQKLEVTKWALHFDGKSSSSSLFGSVDFLVRGGALDYRGRWVSGTSSYPELILSCPN